MMPRGVVSLEGDVALAHPKFDQGRSLAAEGSLATPLMPHPARILPGWRMSARSHVPDVADLCCGCGSGIAWACAAGRRGGFRRSWSCAL